MQKKANLRRINLNIPIELFDKIELYSNRLCLNRTATIIMIINQYFEQHEALEMSRKFNNFESFIKALNEQVEKNTDS